MIITLQAASQSFNWAKGILPTGATASELVIDHDITVDSYGSSYSVGFFYGTVDFDPGAAVFNLTTPGTNAFHGYLLKLDSAGSFQWAYKLGNNVPGGTRINSVVVDDAGYLYVTGQFRGTVDFDLGPGTANMTSTSSFQDVFICKYTDQGGFVWCKQFEGPDDEYVNNIFVDAQSNIYTSIHYYGTFDADPDSNVAYTLTSIPSQFQRDIVISKLDSNGNFVWAKNFSSPYYDDCSGLYIDQQENVYFTGSFGDSIDMDPGSAQQYLYASGNLDAFIAKLDINGNYLWAKNLNAPQTSIGAGIRKNNNEILVVGSFSDSIDIDFGAGSNFLQANAQDDFFLLSLDTNGNSNWIKQFSGLDYDYQIDIAVNSANKIYLTGSFTDTVDFDPGIGVTDKVAMGNTSDIFVLKLSDNGNLEWVETIGGFFYDNSTSIAVSDNYGVYLNGRFRDVVDFDFGLSISNLTTPNGPGVYIMNILDCQLVATISQTNLQLTAANQNANYQWINCNPYSIIAGVTNQNYTVTANGDYAVVVTQNGCSDTSNCISFTNVGINDNERNGISVYPNPSTGNFTISATNLLENASLKVLSTLGKIIYQKEDLNGDNFEIDLSSQGVGLYTLEISEGDKVSRMKLLKK